MNRTDLRNLGLLALALGLMPVPALGRDGTARAAKGSEACAAPMQDDRLTGLSAHGDLVLESGRLARLASIRLPDDATHRDEAIARLRAWAGREVQVQGGPERDRWDRVPARIVLAGESPPLDLAHGLVEAGLALVDAGTADTFCYPELLALEATAREQSLGVWKDDRYKPLDAERIDRLRDRVGSFVLVEGRIRSIGERTQRTYLNFGGQWAEDFTIIVPKKTWKRMVDSGLDAAALKGRRVRARGILEPWQGTSLTILIPDMMESLAGERLPR
jgi:Staphylococcal nuclease homologue